MSGLLTHALEQEIGLPVARLLVSVRTVPQLFELPTGRGLKHGRKRLDERFSGSQARALACLQSASSAISSTVCSARMRESPSPCAYSSLGAAVISL